MISSGVTASAIRAKSQRSQNITTIMRNEREGVGEDVESRH